jgi:hypothetical protein
MATWESEQRSERRRFQRWLEHWRASPEIQALYRALQRRRRYRVLPVGMCDMRSFISLQL